MTEEEAKTKWCPRAGPSRFQRQDELCLGSACAVWRVLPVASVERAKAELAADKKINAIKALREAYPAYGLLEAKQVIDGDRPWPTEEPNGYCGLAGAPQ